MFRLTIFWHSGNRNQSIILGHLLRTFTKYHITYIKLNRGHKTLNHVAKFNKGSHHCYNDSSRSL